MARDERANWYSIIDGRRHVIPYTHEFSCHTKGRWLGRTLADVLTDEFPDEFPTAACVVKAMAEGRLLLNGKVPPLDTEFGHGDKLTHVLPVSDDDSLCFASKQGKVVHCLAASIRPTSLVARGVLSMILDDDDGIAGLAVIHDGKTIMERGRHGGGPWLLLSTKRGYLKRMSVTDFRLSQRRAVGLIGYKFLKKKKKKTTSSALQVNVADDEILSVLVVENEDSHVFLASKEGIMKRASVHDFAPRSRMSAGLPAILLPDDDSLVSLALSDHDDDDEDETTTHTDATPS